MTRTVSVLGRVLIAALLAAALLVAPAVSPAQAATAVDTYAVKGSIAADGTLAIQATITPEGGAGDLVQRFATSRRTGNGQEYRFTLEGLTATIGGQDAGATVTSEDGYTVVTVPTRDAEPVVLTYRVTGAALSTGDETTVVWRPLQGLNLPVRTFDAEIDVPGPFTMIDCAAGAPDYPGTCSWYSGGTHTQPSPAFHDGPRGVGEIVQIQVRFPAATVASNERIVTLWSLDRAFSTAPLPLAVAGLLALLGGGALWLLYRRFGKDARGDVAPTVVGSFEPVAAGRSEFRIADDLLPGQVGTLLDERVDPIDVAATVVDLAVHGSLVICELPRASRFARADWEFARAADGRALRPYEATLLDALAPADAPGRRVSELPEAVGAVMPKIASQLYAEVVERGWFTRRPDQTRSAWQRVGWLSLVIALVLAGLAIAFTPFGLAGLVLVALAVGVPVVGQAMPARTHRGASVLAGLGVLRGQLLTQPTDRMPDGREHGELSRVLPFAIVLGGVERWLDGLAAVDDAAWPDETELGWYRGPDGWRLADLPDSLRNFVTTVEGILIER